MGLFVYVRKFELKYLNLALKLINLFSLVILKIA